MCLDERQRRPTNCCGNPCCFVFANFDSDDQQQTDDAECERRFVGTDNSPLAPSPDNNKTFFTYQRFRSINFIFIPFSSRVPLKKLKKNKTNILLHSAYSLYDFFPRWMFWFLAREHHLAATHFVVCLKIEIFKNCLFECFVNYCTESFVFNMISPEIVNFEAPRTLMQTWTSPPDAIFQRISSARYGDQFYTVITWLT